MREKMSTSEPAKKSRLLKLALMGLGILCFGIAAFIAWGALENYVFAERIHLLTNENRLQLGMTQDEVENIFGVKPEDRKAPDPNLAAMWPPRPHDGVMRYTEMGDREGTYVNYSGWFRGLIVTSQHHIHVTYDGNGKVKRWQRL
jgi:hypothetical protein